MYVDSHVHLQPHGGQPAMTRERIEAYVESARANGVERLAFTEHLFRFQEAYDVLYGWWDADAAHPALVGTAQAYLRDHVSGSVRDYVRAVEQAKSAGLPVLLGVEMDWIPERADELRRFLAPYDWDVVLGSIHWIGSWGFDNRESAADWTEWERRDPDAVFGEYAALLRDLAASQLCDVLAHPDLPKLFGHRPRDFAPLHASIVEAAAKGGCALEVNSHGRDQPVAEPYPALPVLERARAADVPITLASDAHAPERVGQHFDEIARWAAQAGYEAYLSFEQRRRVSHALPGPSRG